MGRCPVSRLVQPQQLVSSRLNARTRRTPPRQVLLRVVRFGYRLDRPPRGFPGRPARSFLFRRMEDYRVLHRRSHDSTPLASPLHPIPHLPLLLPLTHRHPPHRRVLQERRAREYPPSRSDELGTGYGELQLFGGIGFTHRWVWGSCDHPQFGDRYEIAREIR
jgi:hypothetical protein